MVSCTVIMATNYTWKPRRAGLPDKALGDLDLDKHEELKRLHLSKGTKEFLLEQKNEQFRKTVKNEDEK